MDGSPVAAVVVSVTGGVVVYLARNGGWTPGIKGYVCEVKSLLVALGRRPGGRPLQGRAQEVQRLKALMEKFCGERYRKKLDRLRRRMGQCNPMGVVEGLSGYRALRSKVICKNSL